jgi:uncharacterized protein DUF3463
MMISPGYSYSKAPDQEHFLRRSRTREMFAQILSRPKRRWKFNQSPLFLEFLMGTRDYACTPWGNPTYNMFGWQKPCYLLQDGYAETFRELMEETDWDRYGTGHDDRCADCMMHCGYEASAVDHTFGSLGGFLATVRAAIFGHGTVSRSAVTGSGVTGSGGAKPPAEGPPKGGAEPDGHGGEAAPEFVTELPVLGARR